MIKSVKNLTDNEMDLTVCRYLTFPKFINMLAYSAIWFPKLNILRDQYEGKMPLLVKQKMNSGHQKLKKHFSQELHAQIDNMAGRNEKDSRELLVVNCWFLGEADSKKMWKEYSGNEGVAIKSTISKLAKHIYAWPDYSLIGKVKYVDFNTHEMSSYEANQGCERAFLKEQKYKEENEVRIVSMQFKHYRCVDMDGEPFSPEQCAGKKMNNFDDPGLYIGVNFPQLVDSIVMAPDVPQWFEKTIHKILKLSNLNIPIERSCLR